MLRKYLLVSLFVSGCGGVLPAELSATLDRRDLPAARRMHDDALDAPNGGPPAAENRNTGLLLLDRAMIRAAEGDYAGASKDFAVADKIVDGDDILRTKRLRLLKSPAASIYMYQRGWGQALNMPVGLKFYERLLVNPFAALSRLQADDARGACVEARRYGVIDEATDAVAPGRAAPVRKLAELISAVACDAGGDDALACAAWSRAGAGTSDVVLDQRCAHASPGAASDLWVFVAYGRSSRPSWRKHPEKGYVVGITGGAETEPAKDLSVSIDGNGIALRDDVDVDAAARADFTESQTAVELTILGSMKARGGQWSPIAWTTLPAHVAIARSTVSEGTHDVRIRVRGGTVQRSVKVAAGRPGVAFVYVPW